MPSQPVTFGGETPSVDELAGGTPAQVNTLVDAAGALRMRPGIATWTGFPATVPNASPVTSIGLWNGNLVYTTDDRKIWNVAAGAGYALSDTTAATKLDGGLRPVIVSTRTRAIISGGGKPQKWEGGALSARLGGSPPAFSHVTTIAQRVVGNDSGVSGIIYWSDVGDTGAETWVTGLNFREAETKQDPVTGLYENSNELVAIGTETIQMLSPDPSETFTNARTIEVGSLSPYSYTAFDEQFRLIDHRRRYIVSNGRAFTVESTPQVGHELENMAAVSDAWGFRYKFGNYDLGITTFPTDGRTMVYDTTGKNWSEWRAYDTATGVLSELTVTSAYYLASENVTLVGLSNGQIAKLDPDATDDLGAPIVCQVTSSFITRGTSRAKKCAAVRLTFKRGQLAVGATGYLLLSYRDDLGAFCEPFRVDLGDPNDVQPTVTLRSLGTYRTRQWKLVVDSNAFRFAGMEEDYTILDS